MTLEEAQPENKLEVFEIAIFMIDLAAMVAIVYAIINCISHVVETRYLIDGSYFSFS